MHRLLLASLVLALGCRQILGIESGTTDVPSDGLFESDGPPVPDAGICTMTSFECASADVLRVCSSVGEFPTDTACAWGCVLGPTPHCAELEPRGGALVSSDLQPSATFAQLTLTTGHIINTDTGSIGTVVNPTSIRAAGPGVISGIEFQPRSGVGVFRVAALTQSNQTSVVGVNALAIATNGNVTLNGVIDIRGACLGTNAGPGGSPGGTSSSNGSGSGGGLGGIAPGTGGGGGGFGGRGGAGGSASAADNRFGNAEIPKLVGGGGGGGGSSVDGGDGGGGGGAIQIASNGTVLVATLGGINAGGCGGTEGNNTTNGGGGGGAGGVILIEARSVTVSGVLAVNGGGGGGTQTRGASGRLDRFAAAGGLSSGGGGAAGPVIDGFLATANAGGGGGIGRIRINTRTGVVSGTGILSPGFADPGTTATRGVAVVR